MEEHHTGIKLAPSVFQVGNITFENSSYVHLCYHFGGEEKSNEQVTTEGDVLERIILVKRFRRVHADGYETEKGTASHQPSDPNQIDPFDVRTLI